jgi:hypothetical protein
MPGDNIADGSVNQFGPGNHTNIVMPSEAVGRAASVMYWSGAVCGITIAVTIIMSFLFYRAAAQSELQTYQFNLLKACLQSSQCDTQKVLAILNKEK